MKQREAEERQIQTFLMELAHMYFLKIYNQLEEYELHPGQVAVMKALDKKEGMSQRELADWLHIKPPTVAVSIKRMEKKGFLERKPDSQDQRIMRIYLTPHGKEINKELQELLKRNEEELLNGFEEGEIYLLQRFFKQMVDNVKHTLPQKIKESDIPFGQ